MLRPSFYDCRSSSPYFSRAANPLLRGSEVLGNAGERPLDGGGERQGAFAAERAVEIFEAVDEVHDFAARVGAAGCGAKVGAAAEGSAFVNPAASAGAIEQRARAVGAFGQAGASGRPPRLGRHECLAFGEIRRLAGQFEMAALGAGDAPALDRAGGEVGINRPDCR